jgi:hypothetical protein
MMSNFMEGTYIVTQPLAGGFGNATTADYITAGCSPLYGITPDAFSFVLLHTLELPRRIAFRVVHQA